MSVLFENLPTCKYRTLVIDPPWKYGDNLPGNGRGASKHYQTLSVEDIFLLPVPELAEDNAHLWLWATNSFLHEALHLIDSWGFKYKTALTWCKPQIGMGHYLRNTTEHCLLGVRGKLPAEGPKNIPSHFIEPRQKHSQKPGRAYEIIKQISPGPRLDMFSRSFRNGFEIWGNEAPVEAELVG